MSKKFLITGANGQLAREFIFCLEKAGFDYCALTKDQLDIADFEKARAKVCDYHPDILINCAAYNQVDLAEEESKKAFLVNSEAVRNLASACRSISAVMVHFSTDYVFDGQKGNLYTEDDQPNPLNIYGKSKLQGEEAICGELKDFLIFRLSWVFGDGQQNFLYKISQWAKSKGELKLVNDEFSVPTFTEDIVDVVLSALQKNLRGTYHLTSSGHCSRYEWGKYYCKSKGLKSQVVSIQSSEFLSKANRPSFTCMSNQKICNELSISIPTWQDAVDRFVGRKCLEVI